ncbi:hypothetical protein IIA16_01070, partial [bacterium]|nr:hypothetical protein [bacterium]
MDGESSFGFGTFSPIFHYMYDDVMMLDVEFMTSLGHEGETSFMLEYGSLNYFLGDNLVLIGGKFLSPIGRFWETQHPSWINRLPSAPAEAEEAKPAEDSGAAVEDAKASLPLHGLSNIFGDQA